MTRDPLIARRPNNSTAILQKPKHSKRKLFGRALAGVFLIFALLIGAWMGSMVSSPTVRKTMASAITGGLTPSRAFPGKNQVNILLMGRDVDRDNKGNVLKTWGRTDTIILANFNFENKTISLLSIPRDTRVRIPGYGRHKVNAAHAIGGPDLACRTIENLLDVHPDDYIVVDFHGFEKAVDQMGGLTLTVDKQLDYDDNWGNLHIHLNPGKQHLNGQQAIGFVRFRKSNDGTGDSDIVRIARQHEFLRAVKAKLTRPATIMRLPKILDTINGNINSSLTETQILALAKFAREVPQANIVSETLPGEITQTCIRPDREATREIVQRLFY